MSRPVSWRIRLTISRPTRCLRAVSVGCGARERGANRRRTWRRRRRPRSRRARPGSRHPRSPSRCSSARSTRTWSSPTPTPTRSRARRSSAIVARPAGVRQGLRRARRRGGALGPGQGHPPARRDRRARPLRAREVRGPGALADRLRARLRGDREDRHDALGGARRSPVDRLQGHRHLRQRRAEGALAAGPRDRPQARRVRADRAERRLGRLERAVARREAGRRLVRAQRRASATSATARAPTC